MLNPTDNEISLMCNAKLLAIDTETKDPELETKGPGTKRGDGFICGMSAGIIKNAEEIAFYFPLKHPDIGAETTERSHKIITALLESNTPKVGANIIYDLEWLEHEGYYVNQKELHDVQYAEPLLDEYRRSYSLESLAKKYSVEAKKTHILEDYNELMGWKGKPIKNLWKMPSRVVEEYAITDATLPLQMFKHQKLALEQQNLWEVYTMETELIPLLLLMRKNGVRLDMPLLQKTIADVTEKHFVLKEELISWAGSKFNPAASGQLSKILDAKGIPYPRNAPTEKMEEAGKPGNPNLDKSALTIMAQKYPICNTILEYRHFDTIINMFLHPYLDLQVGGKLYGSFHPLRSDEYGTVAGRFSASKPNLQQVSAKKEEGEEDELSALKGQMIRALFIPEEGHMWGKLDYSQVEYRILAHYAGGVGSTELREQYKQDKKTDFHKIIQVQTNFDRRTAKQLNFGGVYGMGIPTAARLFGWTMEEADSFMTAYHNTAPYIRTTRNSVSKVAARRGYIFTILGRKARVHASRKLHSIFNRLIQGSAADVMKAGMVKAYKAGIFNTLTPHLTVHDELDVSYKDDKAGNGALKELTEIMEQAVEFNVPLLVDCHTGKNWAEAD